MSGEMHNSGVQEVVFTSANEAIIPLDIKCMENGNSQNMILDNEKLCNLNSHVNTISNISDGSLCCEVCNIRVTSAKILQRHLEGRKHISRSERKGKTFHCDLCDIKANSELQLNIHLSSSKHKSRVAREEFKEFTEVSSYSVGIYVLFFCALCIVLNLVILVKVAF